MINHAYYSELCSLAASAFAVSGQLSPTECDELIEHLPACGECQELMRNFVQVSFELFPGRTPNHTAAGLVSNGRLQRLSVWPPYLDSPVGPESTPEHLGKTQSSSRMGSLARWTAVASVAAILIVVATMVAFQRHGMMWPPHVQPSNDNQQSGSLVTTRALLAENANLRGELQLAKSHETALNHEGQEHLDAIAAAQRREAALNASIAALESANTRRSSELGQLRQDLERVRSESEYRQSAVTLARVELGDRNAELKSVSAQLSNATRFIATLSEAQDLIEGRDVHVWTAYYADENGKRQKAYARILYEAGKKLVFYAFDLPNRNSVDTRLSFYVWGEKAGTHLPVKNLGILHIDDSQKGRWKLRFDDPSVLAQINRVFVTAEPTEIAGTEPTGHKMLSSNLQTSPDSP